MKKTELAPTHAAITIWLLTMNAWDVLIYSWIKAHVKVRVSSCKPSSPHSTKHAFAVNCYNDLSVMCNRPIFRVYIVIPLKFKQRTYS